MARDEGPHPLSGFLDVGDVLGPEGGAGVAPLAGRELRAETRSAFVTEDPSDAGSAETLPGLWVTGRTLGSLQVTVTG